MLEPAHSAVQPGDHPDQPRPSRSLRPGRRRQHRLHPPPSHAQPRQQDPRSPRRPEPGTRLVPAPRPVHRTSGQLPGHPPATPDPAPPLGRASTQTQISSFAAGFSCPARVDAPLRSPAPAAPPACHPQQQRNAPHRRDARHACTAHGSLYIAVKTDGDSESPRAHGGAVGMAAATALDRRGLGGDRLHPSRSARQLQAACHRIPHPVLVFGSLAVMIYAIRKRAERENRVRRLGPLHRWHAGRSSLRALSGGAAGRAPIPPCSLTIYNTGRRPSRADCRHHLVDSRHDSGLGYFTLLFRMFKGKVRLEGEGY